MNSRVVKVPGGSRVEIEISGEFDMGWGGSTTGRRNLLVGEAKRFRDELTKRIAEAEKLQRPPPRRVGEF